MTSTSTPNNQHPASTSAPDFSVTQTASSTNIDPNANLGTSGYAPNENQLAGLVEAATAAAGQDVSDWAAAAAAAAAAGATGHQHHLDGYAPEIHIEDDGFGDTSFGAGMSSSRHLRPPGSDHAPSGLSRMASKKRKRGDGPLDPALTASAPGMGHSPSHHQPTHHAPPSHHYGSSLDIRSEPPPPETLAEARSVGLHSAAALFRQPSSNKKYTRPPMSKLFASLELSPENFLHLQAAAKSFMLDDKYPERRDCVGQRGKGDTEMVKLRLWNCVRHFLEAEGNGERFFGENVLNEGMGPRTYIWPRDQQKIISLVIPLLRRMVTNERQRQYAVETRKGGGADERRRRRTEDSLQNFNSASPPKFPVEEQLQMHAHHHLHDGYAPSQQPALSASQTSMAPPPSQPMDLHLTDLLLDGYPTDWNSISKSYDMYNHDFELDNLWQLSGLQQPDWRGLVAAVDSHYQVVHQGGYECPTPCEEENLHRILEADSTNDLRWRIGGDRNRPARNEFASSITRDVSRIIRDSLATKDMSTSAHDNTQMSHTQPFPPPSFTSLPGFGSTTNNAPQGSINLHINIMQNGKRILPRLDLPAGQCSDLEAMKQFIIRRYENQLPGFSSSTSGLDQSAWGPSAGWKFKVWLPDGLTPVQNDGEWSIALLSAGNVDWMDGDLRVLVELENS